MNIGLYFGSFNPIHNGHLIIANHIVQYTHVEQVWFIISPQNPQKPISSLLNEYHRLHFVQLAIENNSQLRASDIEFKLPKPSYTIDTLTYLEEKHPNCSFNIIVGSDSYNNIPNWKNGQVLLNRYQFIVYPRLGFPVKSSLQNNTIVVQAPILDISATFIRNAIANGKSIQYLVTDSVYNEIERNGYYKAVNG